MSERVNDCEGEIDEQEGEYRKMSKGRGKESLQHREQKIRHSKKKEKEKNKNNG